MIAFRSFERTFVGLFTSFQLKSGDAETRRRAAQSLGVRGRTSAIASLQPLLDDPEWEVRQAAVEALGVVADVSAVPPLLAAVKSADQVADPDGAAAVRACGGRGARPNRLGRPSGGARGAQGPPRQAA